MFETARNRITRTLCAGALITAAATAGGIGCGGAAEEPEEESAQGLILGTWKTGCMTLGEMQWGTFAFTNQGERGSFTFTLHGNAECTAALADFNLYSRQVVGPARPDIAEGVRELDIIYERMGVIAYNEQTAGFLQSQGCGAGELVVGQEKDITMTGCLDFKSITACPADYDLMRVQGDQFFNGVRTENMCVVEGRPTAINMWSFSKQ